MARKMLITWFRLVIKDVYPFKQTGLQCVNLLLNIVLIHGLHNTFNFGFAYTWSSVSKNFWFKLIARMWTAQ